MKPFMAVDLSDLSVYASLSQNDKKKQLNLQTMFLYLDNLFINTDHVTAVRPVDDGEEQSILFMTGQSAMDGGFLLDLPMDEVVAILSDAQLVAIAQMMEEGHGSDDESTDDELVSASSSSASSRPHSSKSGRRIRPHSRHRSTDYGA